MSGFNLLHLLTVNVKKKFLKSSVRHRKALKQPELRCHLYRTGTVSYR